MPEQDTQTAPPPTEAEAPSAPAPAEGEQADSERPDGDEWLRSAAQGSTYSRALDTSKRSQEWADANAELRRGRRNGTQQEEPAPHGEADTEAPPKEEPPSSAREVDDEAFNRRVQAEVDRREALRKQRADVQFEQKLRRENPAEYAKYKERQEEQRAQEAQVNLQSQAVLASLKRLSDQFDDAAVKPLMDELPEETRNAILGKAASTHGIPQRKLLVEEGLKALKKAAYDDGFAKGKESAQKTLRKSSSFRKELLSELRGEEDEPELAVSNGSARDDGWDMNDWMRAATGRNSR